MSFPPYTFLLTSIHAGYNIITDQVSHYIDKGEHFIDV
jgi:hypothetical protein